MKTGLKILPVILLQSIFLVAGKSS